MQGHTARVGKDHRLRRQGKYLCTLTISTAASLRPAVSVAARRRHTATVPYSESQSSQINFIYIAQNHEPQIILKEVYNLYRNTASSILRSSIWIRKMTK